MIMKTIMCFPQFNQMNILDAITRRPMWANRPKCLRVPVSGLLFDEDVASEIS